jgi:carboxymethylenebutenolidase
MTAPNVSQAMIDAYYEYTHLTLDRRTFVTKLRALAEPESTAQFSYPFRNAPDGRGQAEGKLSQ